MKPRRIFSAARLSLPFASALASLLAGQSAHATPYNWTGSTNGTWNTNTNWSGSLVPTITDDLTILGPANVADALTIDFDADNSAKSLNFTNTAATSITNTTSGANKTLTLGSGGITTGAGAVQLGANVTNQAVNITLGTAQTWNIGAGGMTVTNFIGGVGTGITKTGTGNLTINTGAANGFTGGLTVNRGTLTLDYNNLATPTDLINSGNALTLGGGALTITGKATATTSQTFAGTTLDVGVNRINLNRNGASGSATLNLGALTVNPGSSTTIITGAAGSTTWVTGATPTTEIIKVSSITGKSLPGAAGIANWINVNAGLFYRQTTVAGTARWVSVDNLGQLQGLPAALGVIAAGSNDSRLGFSLANGAAIALTASTNPSIYGLVPNAGANPATLTTPNSGTLTLNGIIQTNTGLTTINAGTGASNLVIGSEKNLVINMDNTGALTINAPIANNGGGTSSVTITSTIPSGTPGAVTLSGANTYSGGTYFSGNSLTVSTSNSALGTGPLTIGGTALQLRVQDGRTIANNIIINAATGTGGQGLIQNTGAGNATLSGGTITINSFPTGGGHFASTGGGTLTVANPINASVQVTTRIGTVIFSGGGSYSSILAGQGTIRLGATNGLSTSATLTIGASGDANFDLAGFNQSLVGLTKSANAATVGNSSTTTDSNLIITGTSNYAGVIQDVLGSGTRKVALTVNGGALTLSGTNTFTGDTLVSAGSLTLGNTLALQNSAYDTASVNGGLIVTGFATPTLGGLTGSVNLSSTLITGYGSISNLTLNPQTGITQTYSGDVGNGNGSMGLTKSGVGTQILSGGNTYSGTTNITAGILQIGAGSTTGTLGTSNVTNAGTLLFNRTDTYTLAAANLVTGAGAVTLGNTGSVASAVDGQFNTTGALNFGSTAGSVTTSTLDLTTGSSNFGNLSVRTNSASANTIIIGSGKTLTFTGSTVANVISVGSGTAGGVAKLEVTGSNGTLTVNDATRNIVVANTDASGTGASAQMNLSGLGTFNATIANLYVGRPTAAAGTSANGRPLDVLTLANTNTITASGVIALGGTLNSSAGQTARMNLGTTNNLNAASFVIGSARTSGAMQFQTGLTTPSVTLRGATGGISRTDIYLGDQGNSSAVSNGGGGSTIITGTMDFTEGSVNAMIGSLFVGYGATTNGGGNRGQGNGSFIVGGPSSNVDVNTLVIAQSRAVDTLAGNATSTGTFTMINGTLVVNTAAVLANDVDTTNTVGGVQSLTANFNLQGGSATVGSLITPVNMILGNHLNSGNSGLATATVNLTGGTLNMFGDIKEGNLGSGMITSSLTLDGATLDMKGNSIGTTGALIDTLTFASGTLSNVASINGTGDLTKTTAGTLIITGPNTYTGATNVNGGNLVVNGNIASSSLLTVASGGALSGTGTVGAAVLEAGSEIRPGSSPGILTTTGNLTVTGASTFVMDLAGTSPTTQYDQLSVGGVIDLGSTAILSLNVTFAPVEGDKFFLILNDSNDAINGLFAGIGDGAQFSAGGYLFEAHYDADSTSGNLFGGNDFALMAVPETSSVFLVMLSAGTLIFRRRR